MHTCTLIQIINVFQPMIDSNISNDAVTMIVTHWIRRGGRTKQKSNDWKEVDNELSRNYWPFGYQRHRQWQLRRWCHLLWQPGLSILTFISKISQFMQIYIHLQKNPSPKIWCGWWGRGCPPLSSQLSIDVDFMGSHKCHKQMIKSTTLATYSTYVYLIFEFATSMLETPKFMKTPTKFLHYIIITNEPNHTGMGPGTD